MYFDVATRVRKSLTTVDIEFNGVQRAEIPRLVYSINASNLMHSSMHLASIEISDIISMFQLKSSRFVFCISRYFA